MKTSAIALFSLVMLLSFSTNGLCFRCGDGLVTSGDTKTQVTVTCGNPTSKEKACDENRVTSRTDKKGKTVRSKKCSKKLDVWYYNCGNNDYIYALTFEDNKLIRETTIGRGKGKSNCLGQ